MSEKFGCVVADPNWRFGNKSTRAAAEDHYRTMNTKKIAAIPVEDWVADNAHLYLWTTDTHLSDALYVMEAWEFKFKMTVVWIKIGDTGKLQIGLGNYYRHAHEICLFGVRGRATALDHALPSVFWAPRRDHSQKPEQLQDMAEKLSPGPFLEMFATRERSGWTSWGMEHSEWRRKEQEQ